MRQIVLCLACNRLGHIRYTDCLNMRVRKHFNKRQCDVLNIGYAYLEDYLLAL